MKIETFFEKYEQFAGAPNAVSKLRELVLHLAVTGRLIESNGAWNTKPLKVLATKIGSGATPAGGRESYFASGVPLIRSMNVHFRGFDKTGLVFLSDEQAAQLANVEVQANDVLLNITGASIGRVTIAPAEMAGSRVNQHVTIIRPTDELMPAFLSLYLASPSVQRMIDEVQVGATRQALTKGMIEQFEVPVPPLAEQKRIVAKVDELMALCDRLAAQQQGRDKQHAALARASLTRFADAPTPANLEFLFHKSYAITPADLRKSILTLAVQGKLVPQESNDEDVEESVRFARKKAQLPTIDLGEIGTTDIPFETPAPWRWVTVADVAEARLGKMLDKEKNRGEEHPYLRNTNVHWFRFELDSIKTMPFERADLEEYRVSPGDVLICEGGHGIARSAVWNGEIPGIMFQKALHRVRPLSCLDAHFFTFCLWFYERDGILQRYYTGAGIPHFTGKALSKVSFPLPPITEQRRIVAKVDQLMALVDQLEVQLAESRDTGTRLMEAVVADLTAQG